MSDNKFAQCMAKAGIVPEEFALAVLGGDCKSADKMLREHQADLKAVIAVIMWTAAGLGRLAGERECKEKSDGSNA